VSLTPLVGTFGLVALLFIGAAAALARWTAGRWGGGNGASVPPAVPPRWGPALRSVWPSAAVEAGALTLVAALWFASLGHGGWPTLFLLFGILAAVGDGWRSRRRLGATGRDNLTLLAASVLKYLLAGWLCAWRLS
jgi:hypothetical protein